MNFKKISRLNESAQISHKREIARKQCLITPGRNAILAFVKKWGSVTESALATFIENLNETEVKTTMEWVRENGKFFTTTKKNKHMFVSLSDIGEKVLESTSNKYSMNVEIIGEGRLAIVKRKYTDKHPAKTVQLVTPVRNKILAHVAEKEKVTRSEFVEFLKQMNEELGRKTSFAWVRRNKHFFKVVEDKETKQKFYTLSAFGKRVLSKTAVNENISAEEVLNEDYADTLIKATADKLGIDISKYDMNQLKIGMEVELIAHGSKAGAEANITNDSPDETLRLVIGNLKLDPFFYTTAKEEEWGTEFFDPTVTDEPVETDTENDSDTDEIPGGEGDNMSIADIAQKHNVSEEDLLKEFEVGKKVELEHTDDETKAEEIARDHLAENPKYYTNLVKDGLVDEPEALELAKEKLGIEPKSSEEKPEGDDKEEKPEGDEEGDADDAKKLLDEEQKKKLKELVSAGADDDEIEKFADENEIDIDDLKAYIELIKDEDKGDDEDDKNEGTDTSSEFKPVVGKVNEKIVSAIQENNFKGFECRESEGSYKIYDSEDNHIATLVKVEEEWQIHSNKSFDEIKEMMLDDDVNESVNEHHNTVGSQVKIKSTGQTGTLQSWDDVEKVYKILLDDGTGKVVDAPDEDVETIEQIGENVNEGTKALDKNIVSSIIDMSMQFTDSDEVIAAASREWNDIQSLVDYIKDYIKPRDIKSFDKAAQTIAKKNKFELKEMEMIYEDDLQSGTKVKCPGGKTGTVQSWDDAESKYIVLTDDGETLTFGEGELTPITSIGENKIEMKLGEDYQFTKGLGTVMTVYEESFVVEWEDGEREEINFKDLEVKETEAATVYNVPGMGNVALPGPGEMGSGDTFDENDEIPANAGLNRKMGRYQMKKLKTIDDFIRNSLQE